MGAWNFLHQVRTTKVCLVIQVTYLCQQRPVVVRESIDVIRHRLGLGIYVWGQELVYCNFIYQLKNFTFQFGDSGDMLCLLNQGGLYDCGKGHSKLSGCQKNDFFW